MTSSFCEFRPRHYHAALDIKTWGKTGYKCFAVEDGYVSRVRVSAYGYGKALYITLKDGRIAVYAHLKRFSPALESYVDQVRREQQKYKVDLYLKSNQFPVKRGDIVAFTGRTGIGYPHLHFEIRNARQEPLNPLRFYPDIIKDKLPPLIYQAALFPLEIGSTINFNGDTLFYRMRPTTRFRAPDTIFVTGRVGLAMKINDRANGADNLFGFYSARMWIDDSLVYQVQYDSFSYAETHLIELDRNFSLHQKGKGVFHNFYRHPANGLPHYGNTPRGGGILDSRKLTPGLHNLRIHIEDFSGNSAEYEMSFRSGEPPRLSYDLYRRLDDVLFLRMQSPVPLAGLQVRTHTSLSGSGTLLPLKEVGELVIAGAHNYTLSARLPGQYSDAGFEVMGTTDAGIPSHPLYLPPLQPVFKEDSLLQVRKVNIKPFWVEVEVRVNHRQPVFFLDKHLQNIPGIYRITKSDSEFILQIPPYQLVPAEQAFHFRLQDHVTDFTVWEPGENKRLSARNGLLTVNLPKSAFYRATNVWGRQVADPAPEKDYRRAAPVFALHPYDQPMLQGARIHFQVPDSAAGLNGLGMYYHTGRGSWRYLPSRWDPASRSFSTRITSMEKFTILQDTLPPLIRPRQSISGGVLQSRNGYVSFTVLDQMSGIGPESNIQIFINNRWQLFDYDPEENLVSLIIPDADSPQSLKMTVQDNSGNLTERQYRVR